MNKHDLARFLGLGFLVLLLCLSVIAWIGNAYRFTQCDFKEDYACEAIHGVGILIAPTAILTVWYPTDK